MGRDVHLSAMAMLLDDLKKFFALSVVQTD
jgi:hypothetical protein